MKYPYSHLAVAAVAIGNMLGWTPQQQASNVDNIIQVETDNTCEECADCDVSYEFSPDYCIDDDNCATDPFEAVSCTCDSNLSQDVSVTGNLGEGVGVTRSIESAASIGERLLLNSVKGDGAAPAGAGGGEMLMEVVVEIARGSGGATSPIVTVRQIDGTGRVIRTVSRLQGANAGTLINDGRAEAARYVRSQGGFCRGTLVRFAGGFTAVAIVSLVYGGYVSAGEAAGMRIISDLRTFYGDCDTVYNWILRSQSRAPADSCQSCYDYYFRGDPRPPGTGAITVCSAHMPNGAYRDLVNLVGQAIEDNATTCASRPGGYYSRPFRTCLFLPDRPNVPDRNRVCPY